jgi:hypothetical protein
VGNLVSAPLLLRRWLTREAGDGPGEVQGAFWLDLKRTYMELRPRLRRNYATSTCPGVYMPVLEPLGGGLIPDGVVELDGRACHGRSWNWGPRRWTAGSRASPRMSSACPRTTCWTCAAGNCWWTGGASRARARTWPAAP